MRTHSSITVLPDARALGAAAGFVVAVASLVVVATTSLFTGAQPWIVRTGPDLVDALPTLIAGTTGGWIFGPVAVRASSKAQWLGVVFGLASVTTLVGAFMTVLVGASFSGDPSAATGAGRLLELVAQAVLLGLLGMVLLGPVVVPLLLIPATVWAALVRLVRGW